jgi:hypothetical protein
MVVMRKEKCSFVQGDPELDGTSKMIKTCLLVEAVLVSILSSLLPYS